MKHQKQKLKKNEQRDKVLPADSIFVPPVVEAVMNTFTMMIQVEPRIGRLRFKSDEVARGAVTGLLKMEGETINGSVSITFTLPVVIDIVLRMLRMDILEVDDIARDMSGELANIVVGGAKNLLEAKGYNISMSLPEVFAGEGHHIKHYFKGKTIEIPFSIDSGDFFVEVNFQEQG